MGNNASEIQAQKNTGSNILVLGVGNILMADEGIGVQIINKMQNLDLPENVELLDGGTAGLDLIPYMKDKKKIIVIDCVDTEDPPGTVYRMTSLDLEEINTFTISSMHQIGLAETIKLSRILGNNAEMIIIGITPKNYKEYSLKISPELEAVVDKVIEIVIQEIEL
ncbi:HyaD/HybD family hydrogenase maturation endopeptidase [Candidatus Contubernalis alkaliaceticus]|uniref:HyaD/HybD family hydrogenase maturation endopeptidase n=1 Tax=Candidatus Contubernalis alkaliaceticus TaxID=338645 RepID=UPI001F4C0BDD|nr:HyaD/HybD family hydrogenase maturation endopeptidase [Candidatus Contubernalis alkalaceticus]UNC92285.1 HyaD/HybD family hydrogenase maturation endopeptidase [Candidatus Contubernalis alkalaceticus]